MKRILATTALVALTASAAFAESHAAAEDGTKMEATESTQMNADASMEPMADVNGMTINASDLIGKRVYVRGEENAEAEIGDTMAEPDAEWEDVGEIGDVIISQDGNIESVVLDAGGFLGIGEKEISTSMDELKFVREEGNEEEYFVVFTGNRAALEEQDELDRDMTRDEGWTFYGERDQAETMDGEQAETTEGEQAVNMEEDEPADTVAVTEQEEMEESEDAAEMEKAENTDNTNTVVVTGDTDAQTDASTTALAENEEAMETEEPREDDVVAKDIEASDDAGREVMTAEDLEGLNVFDGNGEDVGEISDLVVTMDGKITAVIVDVGGFLGIGEKPVALSFDKIEIGRDENGNLVASTAYTEAEMEAAQAFED